jgi:AhpD family alkylhydroperoxidase
MSTSRLPYWSLAPKEFEAMRALSDVVHACSLGKNLLELVFLRASQINGCAFCIDMHTRDLLEQGEDLQRVNSVLVWHDTEFFTPRECAALAWTEAVTRISETHAPDAVYNGLRPHFSDAEIVELTFAITVINSWNRLSIGFRKPVDKARLQ